MAAKQYSNISYSDEKTYNQLIQATLHQHQNSVNNNLHQPISEYSRKYYKGNNYAEIYKYGNGFPNHPPKVVDLQVRWFGKPLPYLYYALRATSSFVSSFLSPSTITSREILINSNTSLE